MEYSKEFVEKVHRVVAKNTTTMDQNIEQMIELLGRDQALGSLVDLLDGVAKGDITADALKLMPGRMLMITAQLATLGFVHCQSIIAERFLKM